MITETQKKKILGIIGHRYVADIKEYLSVNNLFNKSGKPHSSSMITNVMNGQSHKIIEKAIYAVVQNKKEEQKQRQELLKKRIA
ncbi:conserved protein of unknown function [Tenacibaculum sp. 190130A14a]|uniref:Uncharacterized protein n=1 Tax=Tenacibaculum polynesiense TaxID=3137857 RepID=A0ABM9P7B2_9FLAO